MAFIEPIYDRTEEDVTKVAELNSKYQDGTITAEEMAEWELDLKGALNRSDLLRIVNNVSYLADKIGVTIQSQSVPELPTESFYTTLLNNVRLVKEAWMVYTDTPQIPDLPLTTYFKWNAVEKILFDMNKILEAMLWYHAGVDLIAADDIII